MEESAGVRIFIPRHLLRRAHGHNLPATGAAFRAKVNDPIGLGNQIQIMFDHHDGMTGIYESLQDPYQPPHVGTVQTDGWFFEDEEIAFGGDAIRPGEGKVARLF